MIHFIHSNTVNKKEKKRKEKKLELIFEYDLNALHTDIAY